jgi:hypothetical protein
MSAAHFNEPRKGEHLKFPANYLAMNFSKRRGFSRKNYNLPKDRARRIIGVFRILLSKAYSYSNNDTSFHR